MANISVIAKKIAIAICQLVIATAGVAISTAILYFSVKPALSIFMSQASLAINLPLRMRFFPLQTVVGWITGYIAVRNHTFGNDRSSQYVWIIPAIWFTLFFLAWSHGSILVE